MSERQIYTIGHSTHKWDKFLSLLRCYGIEAVVDIRRFPSSQKFPHFAQSPLKERLEKEGIFYFWLEKLGGYRKGLGNQSPNIALQAKAFRNYADYMLTPDFESGLKQLLRINARHCTSLMCAERLYFRCHRRMISDFLVALGFKVIHIEDETHARVHKLSPIAVLEGGKLYYKRLV
jgi:uncharacterized protein (DUF488 family)